ncbi:hypothetical protein B0H19DRAFT_1253525 [Mycena capillaripes]|nr:hypothetical protein B0H19DRAFT_1253525 [Mycena capillaripes]
MPFESLGDDILLHLLSLCDVYTVLSIWAINKSLRSVSLTKQLWLSLMRDLRFRGLLDLPSAEELENYSTVKLVGIIKRIVFGPNVWSTSPGRANVPPA